MKYFRVFLSNDSRLVIGDNEGLKFYFCPENGNVLRISQEGDKIYKEIFNYSNLPGDGFRVMLMDEKQEYKLLEEIVYEAKKSGRPRIYQ